MSFISGDRLHRCCLGMLVLALASGCQTQEIGIVEAQVEQYEDRMADETVESVADLTQLDTRPPVELIGQVKAADMALDETVWLHLPDPSIAPEVLDKRLEMTQPGPQDSERRQIWKEDAKICATTKKYLKGIEREKQFRLTLVDALHRALANNYQIRDAGYLPAISTAAVVQAEAAFDVAFFANINRNNTDQPTPSQLMASATDTTVISGGVRKLLATGALLTLSETMVRIDNPGFAFQTLNPSWTHAFQAELRQPLLRNFGIDFARSQINIRKTERLKSIEAFRQTTIEILRATEELYWNLVWTRREVAIRAEVLSQAEMVYEKTKARGVYDATQTDEHEARAAVENHKFTFLDSVKRVRDAEDQLVNVLNDPSLPLSAEYEIIPLDNPSTVGVIRDHYQAVETVLQRRPEVMQARYEVELACLQMGIQKNQALPQLDVVYRMTMNGLGASSDQAFDQMTGANFIDQYVGVEFLWSFGERAERAGIRIAALQKSQAVLRYKKALDDAITECLAALRELDNRYKQINGPGLDGVIATAESLRSYRERRERMGPVDLNLTLGRQANLAASRSALLGAIIEYNRAIMLLERAKGTLLEYDNVVLSEQP